MSPSTQLQLGDLQHPEIKALLGSEPAKCCTYGDGWLPAESASKVGEGAMSKVGEGGREAGVRGVVFGGMERGQGHMAIPHLHSEHIRWI